MLSVVCREYRRVSPTQKGIQVLRVLKGIYTGREFYLRRYTKEEKLAVGRERAYRKLNKEK